MTRGTTSPDEDGEHAPHATDRYAAIGLADGSVLVYDVEAPAAWLSAEATVSVAEKR